MKLEDDIRRLGFVEVAPFQPEAVEEFAGVAGVSISSDVRQFFLRVGRCVTVTQIDGGVLDGCEVVLLEAPTILSLMSDYQRSGLVPFARDLWGNYFLVGSGRVLGSGEFQPHLGPGKEADTVVFFDNDEDNFIAVAPTFKSFLSILRPMKDG